MQKIFKVLMLLLVVVGLTACNNKKPQDESKDYLKMITDTKKEYTDSDSVNVYITVETNNVTTTNELIYNFDGTSIVSLAHKLVDGDTVYEAYVKEGLAYVNVNGDKSKGTLFDMEAEEVINNYAFAEVTEAVFDPFDKSLMKAMVTDEDKDGVAKLTWDASKYVLVTDGLTGDEVDKAMARFTDIQSKMAEIKLTINYSNNKVTKLESTWKTKDNKTSTITIEFKGTGTQTVTYPADLESYANR